MSLSINVFFSSFFIDLIHCTNSDHISIPNLAEILFERCANSNWTVVFKALITFHHLMSYGSEVRISLYKLFVLPKPFSDREACLGCGNLEHEPCLCLVCFQVAAFCYCLQFSQIT